MGDKANKLAWKGTPQEWTTGEWIPSKTEVRRGSGYMSVIHSGSPNYQTVADVFGNSQDEVRANAHLISGAPEAV